LEGYKNSAQNQGNGVYMSFVLKIPSG
jgi:hypothetical protein